MPFCTAGFTDSHWMRAAFGAVAYGFFPCRFDPELAARLIHSADERVPVDDLELGVGSCATSRARSAARLAGCSSCTTPEGAFGRSRSTCRGGFWGRRRGLVADLYLGYGALAAPCAGRPSPAPPEPCRLPLLACRFGPATEA